MLQHKGYTAGHIQFDPEEKTFSATVAGLKRDVIHFEGATAEEFVCAFEESIDEYLKFCAERGYEPDRAFIPAHTRRKPGEIPELKAAADRLAAALADMDEEEFAAEFEELRCRR